MVSGMIRSQIYNIDSRKISEVLPQSKVIQCTISSPPYYDMKDYGVDGQVGFGQSYEEYLNDITSIFKQVFEHTLDDGTLWIIVDTFKRENGLILLPSDIADRLKGVGWLLQNIIIWKKDKTVPWASGGFVQRKFEYILFFSKGAKYKSYGDRVRVFDKSKLKKWWIKYPERYNPKGRALDEIWEYPIPVQGSWGNEYIRHFCPLPREMVATMISLSTDENDVVFDPFSGTGAVLSQAAYMKRKYIGCEINKDYVSQSKQYIKKTTKDGRREYLSSLDVLGQNSFESEIINLRVLKYGRLLVRRIESEFEGLGRYVVYVKTSFRNSGSITAHYLLIGKDCEPVKAFVKKITTKPPLSKYGIIPIISFSKELPEELEGEFYYSRTNTHRYLKGKKRDSEIVAVISPICVDYNESDY
ncbi:MAG: site-specific DNA-methyltransferase [Bacteroidales bacterium]|nr:site-specific DNA-methyltransferase [Bacteroidales bacterium]